MNSSTHIIPNRYLKLLLKCVFVMPENSQPSLSADISHSKMHATAKKQNATRRSWYLSRVTHRTQTDH